VKDTGPPSQVLELGERPVPKPGPGEIRIRVGAAGVGLPDLLMCYGRYEFKPTPPFTPGQEAAGIVTDPNGFERFAPGQRVMGVTAFYSGAGGFAEEALLVADSTWPVPEGMSDAEAASFGIPFRTAYLGLVTRGQLRPGETLLVHGAAGGTGLAAVQLGKALGATVIAVVGSEAKAALCRESGADQAIVRGEGGFVEAVEALTDGRGVDLVFDTVGGDTFRQSIGSLRYGGRLLAIGFSSGEWADASTVELAFRNASVVGVLAVAPDPEVAEQMREALMDLYARGRIAPVVGPVLEFDALPQALAELEARRVRGKQVLTTGGAARSSGETPTRAPRTDRTA
jgi:NADPH2:quinone reductase